jgi:hypothetical protein
VKKSNGSPSLIKKAYQDFIKKMNTANTSAVPANNVISLLPKLKEKKLKEAAKKKSE